MPNDIPHPLRNHQQGEVLSNQKQNWAFHNLRISTGASLVRSQKHHIHAETVNKTKAARCKTRHANIYPISSMSTGSFLDKLGCESTNSSNRCWLRSSHLTPKRFIWLFSCSQTSKHKCRSGVTTIPRQMEIHRERDRK